MSAYNFKPKWDIHLKDRRFVSHKKEEPMVQYIVIKFDRPISVFDDFISPGGYEIELKNGRRIQFDFTNYEGIISKSDPSVLLIKHGTLDIDAFPESVELLSVDVKDISKIVECYVYTGELDETRIKPVKILFWSINENMLEQKLIDDYKFEV